MFVQQSLKSPFGISTFGSSIIRVEPDIASLRTKDLITYPLGRVEKCQHYLAD